MRSHCNREQLCKERQQLLFLHGVHVLPVIWHVGGHLASCSDINISGPLSFHLLGIKQSLSYKCHNSQQLWLWAQLQTTDLRLGSWCQGVRRTGRWQWGVHARIILADMASADRQSSWLAPEREKDQRQILPFYLQIISHSGDRSQTAKYPCLKFTRFYSMHYYTFSPKTLENDSSTAAGHKDVSLIG